MRMRRGTRCTDEMQIDTAIVLAPPIPMAMVMATTAI
jgi:hypothetical protein